jgi:hypothetical protein
MTSPDKRSFEPDPEARPDLPPKDADQATPDAPDEAKLKPHGDDLQSSLDKATGPNEAQR